jgi:hypothetical protein
MNRRMADYFSDARGKNGDLFPKSGLSRIANPWLEAS